jgi:uncharacterized protein YbjT (DUF2867 family)
MSECILVIGGTRGAGRRIAQRLLADGDRVRVLARDPVRAKAELEAEIEIVAGDLTKPETLAPAIRGADHIILTAGVPSGRYAPERLAKLTDYDGVLHTLAAAASVGFKGRFIYLNSIGMNRWSLSRAALNLLKGNALVWRRRLEDHIRKSGIDYTIIRVGFLVEAEPHHRQVRVTQENLALTPWHRISRSDVAEAFAAALRDQRTSRTTFDIVWGSGIGPTPWNERFARLVRDV